MGALAGCGGQGGGQQQGSDSGGAGQQQADKQPSGQSGEKQAAKEESRGGTTVTEKGRERKSLEGIVAKVALDKDKVFVKPREEKAVAFKFNPENLQVTLNGEQAAPEDIQKGPQATVKYFTVVAPKQNVEQNIAQLIQLRPAGGTGGGGEGTG